MADSTGKWKNGEWAVRDRADVPVELLYLEAQDEIIMARANASGHQLIEVASGTIDEITQANVYGWDNDDSAWNPARLDSSTTSWQVVDYSHHEVHAGSHFYIYESHTLASASVLGIALTTPNTTKWAHLIWLISSSDAAVFTVEEDLTSYSGGTSFTPLNNNRNSATASGLTSVVTGTTGVDVITPVGGSVIWNESIKSGNRIGGTAARDQELILKQNSQYYFEITSAANSNTCSIALEWYEHTDHAAPA